MLNKLHAIIFDFDGLIVDTEYPEYIALNSIYEEYCLELSLDDLRKNIGTRDFTFDPYEQLRGGSSMNLTREQFESDWDARKMRVIKKTGAMPGVRALLDEAREAGVKLAIGSSSPISWVRPLATQVDVVELFDVIVTMDDVSKTKPSPEIFLLAAQRLGVPANQCVVLEDSLNGILAANAAGIRSLWVPNQVTAGMAVDPSQPRVDSLEQVNLLLLDQLL